MKKILILMVFSFSFINTVNAEDYCTIESAQQMAKIIYKEVGGHINHDQNETFFTRLVTASVILNNSVSKNGDNLYEKLLNLTDMNYGHYSTYRDTSFETLIPEYRRSEMLYIAELVLSGKFSIPKEIVFQASASHIIGKANRHEWTHVTIDSGNGWDVYFGYGKSISNKDIFGKTLASTDQQYFRTLATQFVKSDYSAYTTTSVCNGNSLLTDVQNSQTPPISSNKPIDIYEPTPTPKPNPPVIVKEPRFCENPDILRALYIVISSFNLLKIIIPVIIVIVSTISFIKAILAEDESEIKNATNSMIRKIIIGAMIFFIPTIISALLSYFNLKINGIDYNECKNNATIVRINALMEIYKK